MAKAKKKVELDPRKAEMEPKKGAAVTVYHRGPLRKISQTQGEIVKVHDDGMVDVVLTLETGAKEDLKLKRLARCRDPKHAPSWDAPVGEKKRRRRSPDQSVKVDPAASLSQSPPPSL